MSVALDLDRLFDAAMDAHVRNDVGSASHLYGQILEVYPGHVGALKGAGVLLFSNGEHQSGLELMQAAVEVAPNDSEAWSNYGNALRVLGFDQQAMEACQRAIALNPKDAFAHSNLSVVLRALGRMGEALEHARRAVELDESMQDAHVNVACAMQSLGDVDESLRSLRKFGDSTIPVLQNLLFTSLYSDRVSDQEILADHKRFGARFPVIARPPKLRTMPKRIGFVSADFRFHPVGKFMVTLLTELRAIGYECFCYANQHEKDSVTEAIGKVAYWRPIFGWSDANAADQIRADQIDVLIDLSGHSGGNRLPLFALRPAPAQATFLGYSNTTGLPAIDAFIGDEVTNPAEFDALYTEKVFRLPTSVFCHPTRPTIRSRRPDKKPFTFISCNNMTKVTPKTVAVWSKILLEVPGSRLVLKYASFGDPQVQNRYLQLFKKHGVGADRVECHGFADLEKHLEILANADLALDPFPYTGATTSVDAIVAGLPVITLAGRRYSTRMTASILAHLDLDELICETSGEYVRKAVQYAKDEGFRNGILDRLEEASKSPGIFDSKRFGQGFHQVIRQIWQSF